VGEDEIIRSLNAIAHDHGYVQGMNVLLGPFLFVMPELDSYYSFRALVSRHCPRYVMKNLEGIHHACSLVDRCLSLLDPLLHAHVLGKLASLQIATMPLVMTLLANLQPLSEVLRVWDAIFSFGVHLVVLLVCAHFILMRDALLAEGRPYK
jgi:cell cycle arrest protein BUB2